MGYVFIKNRMVITLMTKDEGQLVDYGQLWTAYAPSREMDWCLLSHVLFAKSTVSFVPNDVFLIAWLRTEPFLMGEHRIDVVSCSFWNPEEGKRVSAAQAKMGHACMNGCLDLALWAQMGRKFFLNIWKYFYCECDQRVKQMAHKDCEISVLGTIQNLTGHSLGNLLSLAMFWAGDFN